MDNENYQLLIDKALKFLSFRPRSKYEISRKLQQLASQKNISLQLVDKVVSDLELKNLINDKEFINWWREQRDEFRPKGKKLLKIELRQKGIDGKIVDEVLNTEGRESHHEFFLAFTIAQKRLSRLSNLSPDDIKNKLTSFLARRGFDWETINQVIDTIFKKE